MNYLLLPNETLNDLLHEKMKIIQPQNGYRFSIDPVLLCGFMDASTDAGIIDLGTGNGIIPLILSQRSPDCRIVGIERQEAMADRARRSVELNNLAHRVEILIADIRALPESLVEQSWDVVCTNPPYRPVGSGRIAPDDERAAARHELAGTVVDFVRAASVLLKSGGRFSLIFLAERLPELLTEMRGYQLEPKRLRMVHPRFGEPANLVLVEGRKDGRPGLKVEPPLFIYKEGGRDYTDEVLRIYRDEGRGTRDEKRES